MANTLVTYVHIAGAVYGPGDKVPADVAKRITNPAAWGGKPAEADEADEGSYSDMKVADLRAEVESRNADRDEAAKISAKRNKAVLVSALESDDKAKPDKGDDGDDATA